MKANILMPNKAIEEVTVHKVEVPFIAAFAAKVDSIWYVYEYSTGLRITNTGSKTKLAAVALATERLLYYGESKTNRSIQLNKIINT